MGNPDCVERMKGWMGSRWVKVGSLLVGLGETPLVGLLGLGETPLVGLLGLGETPPVGLLRLGETPHFGLLGLGETPRVGSGFIPILTIYLHVDFESQNFRLQYCYLLEKFVVVIRGKGRHRVANLIVANLIVEILQSVFRIYKAGREVGFLWVPAHVGVKGNEEADEEAKKAMKEETVQINLQYGAPEYMEKINRALKERWQKSWEKERKGRVYFSIQENHFVNGRPTPKFPNPIAAHPVSGREHQGGCRRPPQKRIRCDQPETNTSISTEEHTSQQSDNDTEARDLGNQEEVRTLRDALTAHEEEIISLRVKLEAKDRELHLHNQLQYNKLNPESLNKSHVPDYFQYCTGFIYDQFNIFPPLTDTDEIETKFGPQRFSLPLPDSFTSVSTLINSWVDYMFDSLGKLSVWPHRDIISEHMPAKFKEQFPNTFAILDGTELKIEKPRSLVLQSQTYSTYKSTNTLKSLVACGPRGAVIYVSALFTGSISDKEIFNRCNIIYILKGCVQCGYLNVGDGLMVDKGFLIEKEVEEIGLRLNIPPFARANRQMPHADVDMTKKIAKHRFHVERAIAKIKKFKIVSGRIPITRLSNINQIWYVVSMLSNFQPHIIKY
ncbi:hypothetical protein N1851_030250 [Merluccius polli]|uniref:DDE Tnp4 domain-containing protein n=1 Tax=Merluccius polli TaxID=89951 RepID=A0AA47M5T0_MERPO|nr:hypothetical protein N1851_030250 [Merluccius polli]